MLSKFGLQMIGVESLLEQILLYLDVSLNNLCGLNDVLFFWVLDYFQIIELDE